MKLLKSKFLCKRFPPLCQFNVNTSLALDYKIKAEEQKILRRLSRMIMIGWLRLLFTNPVTSARRQIQPQWQLYWWLRSLTTNCRTGTAAGWFPHLIHHIPYPIRLPHLTREALFEEENSKIKRDIAWMVCGTYFQGVYRVLKWWFGDIVQINTISPEKTSAAK